jgi:hypothetical protein
MTVSIFRQRKVKVKLTLQVIEGKAIPVTGRGGLQGCEMVRISHCLHNRLTDGGKAASLMHRPRSTSQKRFSASGTHSC